jgi:hypothetical protein
MLRAALQPNEVSSAKLNAAQRMLISVQPGIAALSCKTARADISAPTDRFSALKDRISILQTDISASTDRFSALKDRISIYKLTFQHLQIIFQH